MFILDVMETCNNTALSTVLPVVKGIMKMIQFAVPVALLIAFTIQFVRLTINPEEKDSFRKILNKLIAAVIVFVLPFLINAVMGIVGESTEFTNCWVNAPDTISIGGDGKYIPDEDDTSTYTNDKDMNKYDKTQKR